MNLVFCQLFSFLSFFLGVFGMAYCLGVGTRHPHLVELNVKNPKTTSNRHRTFQLFLNSRNRCRRPTRIYYNSDDKQLPLPPPPPTPPPPPQQQPTGIQLYSDIERWVMPLFSLSVLLYAVRDYINLVFLLLCIFADYLRRL